MTRWPSAFRPLHPHALTHPRATNLVTTIQEKGPTWMTRWSSTIFCLARSRMSSSTLPLVTKLAGERGCKLALGEVPVKERECERAGKLSEPFSSPRCLSAQGCTHSAQRAAHHLPTTRIAGSKYRANQVPASRDKRAPHR